MSKSKLRGGAPIPAIVVPPVVPSFDLERRAAAASLGIPYERLLWVAHPLLRPDFAIIGDSRV